LDFFLFLGIVVGGTRLKKRQPRLPFSFDQPSRD